MRVYLLGAGFNLSLGRFEGRPPFLINNFFKLALGNDLFRDRALETGAAVFDYIKHYWRLEVSDLERQPFDLEECYTLLQLQEESLADTDEKGKERLSNLSADLTRLLATYLDDMDGGHLPPPLITEFVKEVRAHDAQVITFNYDVNVERAFQELDGLSPRFQEYLSYEARHPITSIADFPDEALALGRYVWRFELAYGFKFDDVGLTDRGGPLLHVIGDRFYRHPENQLSEKPILKLHGSINWAHFTYVDSRPKEEPAVALDDMIWTRGQPRGNTYFEREVKSFEPALLTPVLNKQYYKKPYPTLWAKAREALNRCDELIVIGYSFPPTDFNVRRLLLEAFRNHSLSRLVVINPDPQAAQAPAELTHSGAVEWYRGYEEWRAKSL